ncbi:MAG: D-aminoacyl-tRNA deacylase [Deltaproteobacteria bacterium]|nr:D-aminoacyl-tRNA deacylase [Deltaproteobacteria bacterium]
MRAVVQRVSKASVTVEGKIKGSIEKGLLVFAGIVKDDDEKDGQYIASKIAGLRIFEDGEGKMNRSVRDVEGEILLISQFTLAGDAGKGRRPSFEKAMKPEEASILFEKLVKMAENEGLMVATGQFQAHMEVNLTNDGPVTILLDSRKAF